MAASSNDDSESLTKTIIEQLQKKVERRKIIRQLKWDDSKRDQKGTSLRSRPDASHDKNPSIVHRRQDQNIQRKRIDPRVKGSNLPISQKPSQPKVKSSTSLIYLAIGLAYKLLTTLGPFVWKLCIILVPLLVSCYVIVGIGLILLYFVICPSLSLLCVFPFAFLSPVCLASFCLSNQVTWDNSISETIKIANYNLTSALYEGHPLMSMSKVLIDTDNAFHEARLLVETSSIPSRFNLVLALEQYDENSNLVQEDLSAFTAQTGSTIDHLLQHIDWAVESLTTINAEFSSPDPDRSRFPQLQVSGTLNTVWYYARSILIPSVIRPYLPLPVLWSSPNTAMARFLVMQEFTLYVLEISPYLAELTVMASKLFSSLQILKIDLENIRFIISHDERTIHMLRRVIEFKRHHLARLQLFSARSLTTCPLLTSKSIL